MTDDVAARRAERARPARAAFLLGDRVEAFAVDDHEGVFGVGVDRDVLARAGFAVGLQLRGVLGRAEQAAAVQRVGDRARAVVAGRLEGAVAAAVDVRPRGDFVARGDHARDDARAFAGRAARGFDSGAAVRERRVGRLERLLRC